MRNLLRTIFTPWVAAGALLFAIILTAVVVLILWTSRPESPVPGASTAVINVIRVPTATPTATLVAVESTPTPPLAGTAEQSGGLVIGAVVEVFGTGGTGLRVRQGAGLSQGVKFLADEFETFLIQDGPVELDGYTWWNLISPSSDERAGWAVADYLRVIQSP